MSYFNHLQEEINYSRCLFSHLSMYHHIKLAALCQMAYTTCVYMCVYVFIHLYTHIDTCLCDIYHITQYLGTAFT